MSPTSSRAPLARLSEETFPPRRGTPLMQEPPPPPEPELEEPEWEEPEWEEPVFENVTIASVVWSGNDDWDRAVYKLSNGYSAFASKGLRVGESPFDYEELRAQGGGYYNAPAGIVGHVYTRNGGALIIKEGSTFKQQQYGWGNQGPVLAASKQDVTSQIGRIEEMSNSDIDGDGEIGAVEPEEAEVEVDSVVYDNQEGNFDRAIYKMMDGTVFAGEPGLEKGDVPMQGDTLTVKGGASVKLDGLVGAYWARNGLALVYNNNGAITQETYKFVRGGMRRGKVQSIKPSQFIRIEDELYVDINEDGFIGEWDASEVEVDSVLYENKDGDFDRSIYKMADGSVAFAEQGLGQGDLPMQGDRFIAKDGGAVPTDGLAGAYWTRNGVAIIYSNNGLIQQQGYKQGNSGNSLHQHKKSLAITKLSQIIKLEDRLYVDLNKDGFVGEPDVADAEVDSVVFRSPFSSDDPAIYKMTDGSVYLAEHGLEKGDTPLEGDQLTKKDGKPIDTADLTGAYWSKKGLAIVYSKADVIKQQEYKWGNRGLREIGKFLDVTKRSNKLEEIMMIDLNNDKLIAGQIEEDAEVVKVIYNYAADTGLDRSVYQMSHQRFVLAEPGLVPGEIPFESDVLVGANGQPFDASQAVGLMGMRNGDGLILKSGNQFLMQSFAYAGCCLKAKGKSENITRRIHQAEEREEADFTNDGIIGKPHSGKSDPEISRVIFPGNDRFDDGLYQMQDGTLLFAEPDLSAGDSPFEDEVINGKNGKPYQASNVVGVYPIKGGFSLVSDLNKKGYVEQGFKDVRGRGARPFGKPRKIKNIDKIERRVQFDINNDQKIGGALSGQQNAGKSRDSSSRLIDPLDLEVFVDPLA